MYTRRRNTPKRAVRWTTATINAQIAAIGAQVYFDALGGLTLGEKNEIRRVITVHGRFSYSVDTAGFHTHGRYGLIVQNDDAIASGTTAGLLDPIADSGASWMWNDHFHTEMDNSVQSKDDSWQAKASRLINPGFSLVFALEVSSVATDSVHWSVAMRLLLEHR